jgi:hypothetical protein
MPTVRSDSASSCQGTAPWSAPPDDLAHSISLKSRVVQDLAPGTNIGAEQQVLSADGVVAEHAGRLYCYRDIPPGPFSEPLKHGEHLFLSPPLNASGELLA